MVDQGQIFNRQEQTGDQHYNKLCRRPISTLAGPHRKGCRKPLGLVGGAKGPHLLETSRAIGLSRADRGIGGVRPVAPPTWLVSNFLVPGDLPNPGIEPGSPALQVKSSPSEPPGIYLKLRIYM